jgi:ADP-heptose:LPS heptosyltransferase
MLPIASKEVRLVNTTSEKEKIEGLIKNEIQNRPFVVVHAGKHWPAKTFPKNWWDKVIETLKVAGAVPVLVGGDVSPMNEQEKPRSTVDVETEGCIDFRNKLSLMETVALLKRSKAILTNDSAILHMAVDSDAWIIYITLAKHPDLLTHYRSGVWGWRMKSMEKGGMWNKTHVLMGIDIKDIEEKDMIAWLPRPEDFANEALSKL